MLTAAGRRGAASQLLAMDGEEPVFEGRWFDLILSSPRFPVVRRPARRAGAAARAAAAGREPLFRDHGRGEFASWRAAHDHVGETAGIADYPTLAALQAMLAQHADAFVCDEHHALPERGGTALVRHFRGIGAQVPRAGYRSLGPSAMRRVIRAFDEAGGETSYHVLYGRITHAG